MSTIADLFNLAIEHHQNGNLPQAEALYRIILQAEPNNAEACHLLGYLAHQTGRDEIAVTLIRQAIAFNSPATPLYYLNLGSIYTQAGRLAEAEACFRQALRIHPTYVEAYNNLGTVLFQQGKMDEGAACFRQALRLRPDYAEAAYHMGNGFFNNGNITDACACFRQALAIDPHYVKAHNNLGNALGKLGRLAEAAECYRQALACAPGNPTALWNRALLRLLQGDFAGGWPDFTARANLPGNVPRPFRQPRWDGTPLTGKTILVFAEQAERGLGDTIQFSRYVPLIKQRGGQVVLECQTALGGLLGGFPGIDQLLAWGDPLPPFDLQIPLFHLPALFGTTFANLPAIIPYVFADPERVVFSRQEIRRGARRLLASEAVEPASLCRTPRLHIGIVWQGSLTQQCDLRSVPLPCFEALNKVEGIRLVSLQVGAGREQLTRANLPLIDLGGQFEPRSLDDLAATMMNLDLIVTVDTAAAHLAGALGVPVWTLLPLVPDWRWQLHRTDSPWYPTMKLFRQSRFGDWDEVFQRVAAALSMFSLGSKNQDGGDPQLSSSNRG